MIKDMGMSCDESVIKQSGWDIRTNYSKSLLALSFKQSGLLSPLSFGESNIKSRIRNILNYKSPKFWVIIISAIIVAVTAASLLTNYKEDVAKEVFGDERPNLEEMEAQYYEKIEEVHRDLEEEFASDFAIMNRGTKVQIHTEGLKGGSEEEKIMFLHALDLAYDRGIYREGDYAVGWVNMQNAGCIVTACFHNINDKDSRSVTVSLSKDSSDGKILKTSSLDHN